MHVVVLLQACRLMKEKVAQLRQQLELRKKRLKPSEPQGDEGMESRASMKRPKQSAMGVPHEKGEPWEGSKDDEDQDSAEETDAENSSSGEDDIDFPGPDARVGMGPSFDWRAKQV